jgi:hypothetical protein
VTPSPKFPKLTQAECSRVVDWVSTRLRPLSDVLAELERPEILEYLDSISAPRLDDEVKRAAEAAYVAVGGSNGPRTFKREPTYRDVDVYFVIDTPVLLPTKASMLAAVVGKRLTQEVIEQRDRCTIEGIEMSIDGWHRILDVGKLGTFYGGISWMIPNRCRHCDEMFYDGRFVPDDRGSFLHESCR